MTLLLERTAGPPTYPRAAAVPIPQSGEGAPPLALLNIVRHDFSHGGRSSAARLVARAAAEQRSLVTRGQLVTLGLPPTRIDSWLRDGRLYRVHDGVYAVGHPALTREGRWLAAVLACGAGAVLSHRSAAALWGLIPGDGAAVDVTTTSSRRPRPGIAVHRTRCPVPATEQRGLPATTLSRTLIDLAATFTRANLERALGEAELVPAFDEADLHRAVAEHAGRRGVRRLADVLSAHEGEIGVPRNVLERRFLKICRAAGLPRPEANRTLLGHQIDFLWRAERVTVETDGRSVHARRAAFARDRLRDRELQLAGYLVLRFTYTEVMRRPAVVTAGCCRACASGPARAWSAGSPAR
jgi:predicted transcriptional regulator of viral defense system